MRGMFGGRVLVTLAFVAVIGLGGCSSSTEAGLPSWPAGVGEPAEYAFGDAGSARSQHAWGPVLDTLATRFERLRVVHLTLRADIDAAALRRDLDREMIETRRWKAVAPQAHSDDAWVFGYESPDGRQVLMLVGPAPRPGDSSVPLTVLTTLPDAA